MMYLSSPPTLPSIIACIMERASDSSSDASSTPSCKAKAFVVLAGKGDERTLLEAAMEEPLLSRIMTPMLDGLPSSEAVPSTLILMKPVGGGFPFGQGRDQGQVRI